MPNRRQAVIWTNAEPTHWHKYAALAGDGLTHWVWTIWPPLCRWHFQMLSLQRKMFADSNFLKVCSQRSSQHYFGISPGNGLVSNRTHAIITCTNGDTFHWCKCVPPSLNELTRPLGTCLLLTIWFVSICCFPLTHVCHMSMISILIDND